MMSLLWIPQSAWYSVRITGCYGQIPRNVLMRWRVVICGMMQCHAGGHCWEFSRCLNNRCRDRVTCRVVFNQGWKSSNPTLDMRPQCPAGLSLALKHPPVPATVFHVYHYVALLCIVVSKYNHDSHGFNVSMISLTKSMLLFMRKTSALVFFVLMLLIFIIICYM